jgi:DNA-directed RNA polymerase subunit H
LIDNILVPKHEVLPPEEAEKLLEKYKVTREELPKIKITDPALSKASVNRGDIIKITRNNPVVGYSMYYRVVV